MILDKAPPFIYCPADVYSKVPQDQNFVHLQISRPDTNLDWSSEIETEPLWAKELQGNFLPGLTSITFRAINSTEISCRLLVIVQDDTKPIVEYCPESFEVVMDEAESSRAIFWKEPTFLDNVGVDHVIKTKEPGCILPPGSHMITYYAFDTSQNKAECSFYVTVKKKGTISLKGHSLDVPKCPYAMSYTRIVSTFYVQKPCSNIRIRHFNQGHTTTRIFERRHPLIDANSTNWNRRAMQNPFSLVRTSKALERQEKQEKEQQMRNEEDLEKWRSDVQRYHKQISRLHNNN